MQSISRSSIGRKFEELRDKGESALVAYLTANDPSPEAFRSNCEALVEGGADILEIGIPFSDPIADGPVIQASSGRALAGHSTLAGILEEVKDLSSRIHLPIVLLTYYNPILAMGRESFLKNARSSGVSGVVIPDLPFEEGEEFGGLASKYSIDRILLAAPNTPQGRLKHILDQSQGFLYLVSLYGVTGPRDTLSTTALQVLKHVKQQSNGEVPVCAGFGISSPKQVSELVSSGADGVIVGSYLVRIVAEHLDHPKTAAANLKMAVSDLKETTTRIT
ncbi:MAG TPA: tryptophan synthase subunit alpha [Candidatus Bathyarchaeia archaeon]|nr:tryptophan synthase subunit alpha [Candidatus Bathyarchaeia archaeon]